MRRFIIVCILALVCWSSLAVAGTVPGALFKKYNPDIDKYELTRNFIQSLSYYKRVSDRLKKEESFKQTNSNDLLLIQKYIEDRTLDNTELRIARNMLTKFTSSKNGLVLKVSTQAINAYNKVIELSMRERGFWRELYHFKTTGNPAGYSERQFTQNQLSVFAEKKEADKMILSASVLLHIVLLNAGRCDDETCKRLVLTDAERHKLGKYLDAFAQDNMDWGIKAGQSLVEGAVAAIREVLEDPVYISADQ